VDKSRLGHVPEVRGDRECQQQGLSVFCHEQRSKVRRVLPSIPTNNSRIGEIMGTELRVLPYSYSSLTSFETCAYKHYMVKVAKLVPALPFKAAQDGTDVHKQAEDYINERKPFDGTYAPKIISIIDEMRKNDAPIGSEVQLCVNRKLEPVDWKDPTGHARGILDVLQITGPEASIRDWKTGKPDPFSTQLKHNAILVFAHNPQVNVINTEYIWLKAGFSTKAKLHREFMKDDWDKFERRVFKLEQAVVENNWPKKKSGLCKQYCPVTECEHNGLSTTKT
jgi:hypothetical protein